MHTPRERRQPREMRQDEIKSARPCSSTPVRLRCEPGWPSRTGRPGRLAGWPGRPAAFFECVRPASAMRASVWAARPFSPPRLSRGSPLAEAGRGSDFLRTGRSGADFAFRWLDASARILHATPRVCDRHCLSQRPRAALKRTL